MGTCVSTVFGTPRRRSPKRSTSSPSDDSDNKELPGEVNGNELLRNTVHSTHPPDDVHENLLPDVEHHTRVPDDAHNNHRPDDLHDKTEDVKPKRRALLVGITYSNPWNTWSQLDGPHGDVDQYHDLLISAYINHTLLRFVSP